MPPWALGDKGEGVVYVALYERAISSTLLTLGMSRQPRPAPFLEIIVERLDQQVVRLAVLVERQLAELAPSIGVQAQGQTLAGRSVVLGCGLHSCTAGLMAV